MHANDRDVLEAALVGYQHQLEAIDGKIAEIKSKLGSQVTSGSRIARPEKGPRKRRKFSKETRRKMADAQKRRWAAKKQAD